MDGQPAGQIGDVEGDGARLCGMPQHDRQQPEEGEHAAGQRVDEELHGRLPPFVVVGVLAIVVALAWQLTG